MAMGAPPSIVHLPDGQNFTVTPVFAGFFFKSHELTHRHSFPIGWTVVLHTRDSSPSLDRDDDEAAEETPTRAYTRPTLQSDCLFISSISNPSSSEFKPPASPTRQMAMMLWVTLYWYFQQPAPSTLLPATTLSAATPEAGRPRGDWRINIKRSGALRGRNVMSKLERMGLVATLETQPASTDDDSGWDSMFVSRRAFWQIPARLFLFTLAPRPSGASSSSPGTPVSSRPGSPRPLSLYDAAASPGASAASLPPLASLVSAQSFPIGPFYSSAHLPTYYPPGPAQYTMAAGVRHPIRPKSPHTGEVFYSRFVPSAGAYLSFRVASPSPRPIAYQGAVGPVGRSERIHTSAQTHSHLATLCDTSLLQMWLGKPRVSAFWGSYTPSFLTTALASKNSFPVIALWDGIPFAYIELYWLLEDPIARCLGPGAAGDWDRGLHVLVGEDWARGEVQLWLSSIVHWIFTADYRTASVCVEPRIDNERFIHHLQAGGFEKEAELSLPHKQAWFGRLKRENWEGPAF